jgi:hypothetical protein
VTLDRRAITPPFEEIAVDELRLRGSFELLPSTLRSKGVVRLLFVGQLTPERVRVLGDLGVHAIDRTAAWHLAMKRFEDVLWDQLPVPEKPPEGAILSLDEARARIAGGEYDLVLVPSTPGDPPRTRQVDVPAITTVVRWIGIDEPMVSRDLGEQVAFTADGFEFPAVALLTHAASTEGPGVSAPLLIAPGVPRAAPTPFSWLQVRKSERGDLRAERARADVMARFAAAAASGPDAELLAGLANFQAAQ